MHSTRHMQRKATSIKIAETLTLAFVVNAAAGFLIKFSPDLVQQLIQSGVGAALRHHATMCVIHVSKRVDAGQAKFREARG